MSKSPRKRDMPNEKLVNLVFSQQGRRGYKWSFRIVVWCARSNSTKYYILIEFKTRRAPLGITGIYAHVRSRVQLVWNVTSLKYCITELTVRNTYFGQCDITCSGYSPGTLRCDWRKIKILFLGSPWLSATCISAIDRLKGCLIIGIEDKMKNLYACF